MGEKAAKLRWNDAVIDPLDRDNGPIDLKKELSENYEIQNIHVSGYPPPGEPHISKRTKRILLHWNLVVDCKHKSDNNVWNQLIQINNHITKEDIVANNGKRDVPIHMMISETRRPSHKNAQTKFTFPITKSKQITAKDLFDLFDEKGYNRYQYDENGNGCLYWVKCILSDMIALKWFDTSDVVKGSLEKLDSFKKGSEVGTQYYIEYGIGTFEKKRGPPKLEIS